jgi:ribonuclease Y
VIFIISEAIIAAIFGLVLGFIGALVYTRVKLRSARENARKLMDEARKEVEATKREAMLEVKEDALKVKNELERENRERRADTQRLEKRLLQKEESLDRKYEVLEKKEEVLNQKEHDNERLKVELEETHQKHRRELEKISGLSSDEAKALLLKDVEDEIQQEISIKIRDMEEKAKEESDRKAREIISQAIQKCAADHVAEATVSVVALPNDEMKGRIIGREGRNIRALETATGIDLIIDDTPEAVILSGFDPVRREIARLALEKLIADGRIHPARIEEMVEKARKEVDAVIKEEGEQATFATGLHGIHPELVRLLGRLRYRTSYGQNVLKHSIEVAHLCAAMAGELGADITMAKRAGLLHDLGKAVDHWRRSSQEIPGKSSDHQCHWRPPWRPGSKYSRSSAGSGG